MKHLIAVSLLALTCTFAPGITPAGLVPSASAQEQRLPIAVLNLSAKGGITESEASIITDRIRTLVVQSRRFEVMERESMDKILREQGFQTTQDCDSNACSIEIGRLLSVRAMITGGVSKLGNLYSLNLRVIDVERGTILKEDYVDCSCTLETLLVDKTGMLLKRLLGLNAEPLAPVTEPTPPVTESLSPDRALLPIRRRKPFLVSLEGGYLNFATLSLQFNFSEYFAARLGAGYGMSYYPGYDSFGGGIFPVSTTNASAFVGARFYLGQDPFAFFGELNYSVNNLLSPRIGVESRSESGFTWQVAAGWAFGFIGGSTLDAMAGVGYAF